MGAYDTILNNFKNSQLGQAVGDLPSDTRTPEQKMQDMIASDPNTPANATPVTQPVIPAQAAPVQGLGGSPLTQPIPAAAPPAAAPFVPAAPAAAPNIADSYKAAAQSAQQIQNALPHGGIDTAKSALTNLGNIQAQGSADQAKLAGEQADIYGNLQDTLQQKQDDLKTQLQPVHDKIDAVNDEIANSKVDPNRYWSNQTTGNKILAGIGLALSAFGGPEAVAKTNNILQSAVDRDIASQKHDYEVKKQNRDNLVSTYAMLRNQGLDDQQATIGATQIGLNQVKSKMQQVADNTQSQAAKENARLGVADFQQRLDANAGQLTQAIAARANQPQYNQTLPANFVPSADQKDLYVNGYGLARDKESAAKLADMASEINPVINAMSSLKQIYSADPDQVKIPGTEANARAQSALQQLTVNQAAMQGIKRYNPDMFDMIKAQGSDITKWSPNTLAKFQQLTQGLAGTINGRVDPYLSNKSADLGARLGTLVK